MELIQYDTRNAEGFDKLTAWNDVVNTTYFPLSLEAPKSRARDFQARISSGRIGHVDISITESAPLSYIRNRYHVGKENADYFLITFPELAAAKFRQNGREVICKPGEFVVEGSKDPFEFSFDDYQRLRVLRISGELLRDRLRGVDDLMASCFSASSGSGALLKGYLDTVTGQLDHFTEKDYLKIGDQIIDLVAMVLETSDYGLTHCDSAVREAHLHRIYNFLHHNLANQELSTKVIASHCGVSLRYLHQLFESTGTTVSRWIREQRLEQCHAALRDPDRPVRSISELAYRWGFADQSHFCRLFKSHYNLTPRQMREQALNSKGRSD